MSVSPEDGGTVEIDGQSYATFPADVTFDSGKTVALEAIPSIGFTFTGWSGDLADAANPAEVTMTCPRNITANFSPIMHNLDIRTNGSGSTSPSAGSYSYAYGENVTVTATPEAGWRFDRWTGDVSDARSPATEVNIDASKNITANFVRASPAWLLPLLIVAALALVGIAVWYYLTHRKPPAAAKKTVTTRRKADKKTKKRRKKKRRW